MGSEFGGDDISSMYYVALAADLAEEELDMLRAAIAEHKRNVWGDAPVERDEDLQLYKKAGLL